MPVSLNVALRPVYDLCSRHTGGPHSDLQMHVVMVSARSGDKTGEMGPICMDCLLRLEHMMLLEEPVHTGGRRGSASRVRKLSTKQERDTIEQLGGRAQPGSGALPSHKSDARVPGLLRVEDKFTFSKSYSLKLADLDKVRGECTGRENPSMVLDFKDKPTGKTIDRWAIIPFTFFRKLLQSAHLITLDE